MGPLYEIWNASHAKILGWLWKCRFVRECVCLLPVAILCISPQYKILSRRSYRCVIEFVPSLWGSGELYHAMSSFVSIYRLLYRHLACSLQLLSTITNIKKMTKAFLQASLVHDAPIIIIILICLLNLRNKN